MKGEVESLDGETDGAAGYRAHPIDNPFAPPLILIVDDSHEAAEIAAEALVDVGYRVVVAHSAETALERFDEVAAGGDGFKLVFTDVIMPGARTASRSPNRSARAMRTCLSC